MTASVHFLNVGWGDAHLIRHPSGAVTLIDGGDGGIDPDQDHPLSWMERNGIRQLDWMILTHIHEDHQTGLLDIAKVKKVGKAVLPYEPFGLPSEKLVLEHGSLMAVRVYRMLACYLELVQALQAQGTEIIWRSVYSSEERSMIWSEEGMELCHLYPWEGDPLPAYEALMKVARAQPASSLDLQSEWLEPLESFFELSNHDSSVYRLAVEREPEHSVLFGGDQLEPGWERLMNRIDLKSRVWKVSHHGMSDGFNARLLAWIQPEHCVIPICLTKCQFLQPHWDELRTATNASFHLTGEVPPGEHRHVVTGSIHVEIG